MRDFIAAGALVLGIGFNSIAIMFYPESEAAPRGSGPDEWLEARNSVDRITGKTAVLVEDLSDTATGLCRDNQRARLYKIQSQAEAVKWYIQADTKPKLEDTSLDGYKKE